MRAAYKLAVLAILVVIGIISYQQYQAYQYKQEVKAFAKQFNQPFNQFYDKTENEHAPYSFKTEDLIELKQSIEESFDHKKFKQNQEFRDIYELVVEAITSALKMSNGYFSNLAELDAIFETNPGLFADDGKYQKARRTFKHYNDWIEDGYVKTLSARDAHDEKIDKARLPKNIRRLIKSFNTIVHRPLAERIKSDNEMEPTLRACQKMLKWVYKNKDKFKFTEDGEMEFFKIGTGRELANLQRDFDFQLQLFKKRRNIN